MSDVTRPRWSNYRSHLWFRQRVVVLIAILATFIAGSPSWCVDTEMTSASPIAAAISVADGQALNGRSTAIAHSCDDPVYLHQNTAANLPSHLFPASPVHWIGPSVPGRGVYGTSPEAQTDPPQVITAWFAPRAPPHHRLT